MLHTSSTKAVFIVAAMSLSLTASAQVLNPANPNAPTDSDAPFPLHIAASMTQTIGTGTFVLTHANNPLVATNLVLNPYALLGDWTLAASQSYDLEWTSSDFTTYPQQFIWGDVNLRAQYRGLSFPEYKLMTNFTMGLDIPVSIASNWQGQDHAARRRWNAHLGTRRRVRHRRIGRRRLQHHGARPCARCGQRTGEGL